MVGEPKTHSPEVGRRPQLLARMDIDVWENVWEKFGIGQQGGTIPSKVMAGCMGKLDAMAAGVYILMEDVQ